MVKFYPMWSHWVEAVIVLPTGKFRCQDFLDRWHLFLFLQKDICLKIPPKRQPCNLRHRCKQSFSNLFQFLAVRLSSSFSPQTRRSQNEYQGFNVPGTAQNKQENKNKMMHLLKTIKKFYFDGGSHKDGLKPRRKLKIMAFFQYCQNQMSAHGHGSVAQFHSRTVSAPCRVKRFLQLTYSTSRGKSCNW